MIEWKTETRNLKDLVPNAKNPRRMNKDMADGLKKSLEKFGLCEPIVINWNGEIIGGHQRVKTLQAMGRKQAQVMVPVTELSDEDKDELCIRLNKNQGYFDDELLANAWEIDLLLECGFTEQELLGDIEQIESSEEEGELLSPPKDPTTKLGDLYILGNHRLLCGDSTNPDHVSRLLDGSEPILMVTDPPYGVEYDPNWRGKAGKGQKAAGKVQNDDKVNWSLAWHLFPGSVAYVWHAGKFCSEVQKTLEEAQFEIINQIVWSKQNFALSRGDYHWQHEPCWYAVKKGQAHNWQGARDQATIWEISNLNAFGKGNEEGDERTCHSTQKPMECMGRPIKNNSAEGEGVYDPFCGSGTTLMACEKLNRNAFCMELDPAYCDVIVERWKKNRTAHNMNAEVVVEEVK